MLTNWISDLENEDLEFIRKFVLCSGSLKNMAKEYNVTYPTVRLRLDRLIQKINLQNSDDDNYISKIQRLALDDKIDFEVAKTLIKEYKKTKEVQK